MKITNLLRAQFQRRTNRNNESQEILSVALEKDVIGGVDEENISKESINKKKVRTNYYYGLSRQEIHRERRIRRMYGFDDLQEDIIDFLEANMKRSKIFYSCLVVSDCYLQSQNDIDMHKLPPASHNAIAALPGMIMYPYLRETIQCDDICTICCDKLVDGIALKRMPCGHVYHTTCLVPWLKQTCVCPECRYEIPCTSKTIRSEIGRQQRMANRFVEKKCHCNKSGSTHHTCFFPEQQQQQPNTECRKAEKAEKTMKSLDYCGTIQSVTRPVPVKRMEASARAA